jgi:hypothetical protein
LRHSLSAVYFLSGIAVFGFELFSPLPQRFGFGKADFGSDAFLIAFDEIGES